MLEAGARAPDFTLKETSGVPWTLREALARGPVLLTIYKISCPVCQGTLPFLDRITKSESLQVVAISQDDESGTAQFREKFGGSMTTLLDPEEDGYRVSNAFAITHVPSIFLIEPDGLISLAVSGFSKSDLESIARRAAQPIFREGEKVKQWVPG